MSLHTLWRAALLLGAVVDLRRNTTKVLYTHVGQGRASFLHADASKTSSDFPHVTVAQVLGLLAIITRPGGANFAWL